MNKPESKLLRAIGAGLEAWELIEAIGFVLVMFALIGYVVFRGCLTLHK
jgi:hypothetical protein